MSGLRREEYHYTTEQVRGHLVDALEVLVAAEVPAELAPTALALVFDRLSAKQVMVEQVAPALGVPMLPRA